MVGSKSALCFQWVEIDGSRNQHDAHGMPHSFQALEKKRRDFSVFENPPQINSNEWNTQG